jgi:hypothetical protein
MVMDPKMDKITSTLLHKYGRKVPQLLRIPHRLRALRMNIGLVPTLPRSAQTNTRSPCNYIIQDVNVRRTKAMEVFSDERERKAPAFRTVDR